MKKFKFVLGVFILAVTLLSTTTSCEEESTGNVVVYNYTNKTIIADVVDGNNFWVGEKSISSGRSKIFIGVTAGSIKGAARFSGSTTWYYSNVKTLAEGSSISITWYPAKKSAQVTDSIRGE